MRTEEEIRTVLNGFVETAINTKSIKECEWCGVATGVLLWVLEEADSGDVADLSLDKFGGR